VLAEFAQGCGERSVSSDYDPSEDAVVIAGARVGRVPSSKPQGTSEQIDGCVFAPTLRAADQRHTGPQPSSGKDSGARVQNVPSHIKLAVAPATGLLRSTAMATTDPAEQAAQQASELASQKIDRVKELARTVAAEEPLGDLVAAAKRAGEAATGDAEEHVREAQRAAEAALKSARQETQVRRKAATDAGWSIPELAQMNLAKARAPRKAKSKSSTNSTAADNGSASPDTDGAPATNASPFPAETSSSATG
jgi:hypothetical protein